LNILYRVTVESSTIPLSYDEHLSCELNKVGYKISVDSSTV